MAGKNGKHYPTQRTIRLIGENTLGTVNRRIEADRILSETNRRLYRQSKVYPMKIDIDLDSPLAASGIKVYALNDTWDLHGAYKYAMKSYYNAMKEEMEMSGGQIGRWHDFRIITGVDSNLLVPLIHNQALSGSRVDVGEHSYTQIVDSAGTQRGFGLQAATDAFNYSILSEWSNVDQVDDDPVTSSANTPYNQLTDEIDDANRDRLQSEGDEAPYNTTAITSPWRRVATLKVGPAGEQKLSTGFFDAPLGMVILVGGFAPSGSGQDNGIQVSFQHGDYKGVKAYPYATPKKTANGYEVV